MTRQGGIGAIAMAPFGAGEALQVTEADDAVPLPGLMPNRLPENAPPANFDARGLAKSLLRTTRASALATIDRNTGHPFASLVNVATDVDGSPLILISRLSTHTANLEDDGRASLLFASVGRGDPLAYPRLTVLGTFMPVARQDAREPRLRRRFLPVIRNPSSTPVSPISRSGNLKSFPRISTAALAAPPI